MNQLTYLKLFNYYLIISFIKNIKIDNPGKKTTKEKIKTKYTLDIKYFIDWEDTIFYDFNYGLGYARLSWDKSGFVGLTDAVISKYTELYEKHNKQG